MIWIIAGTSEAREIINRNSHLDSFIATVATDEGREMISSDKVVAGPMNYNEMKDFSIQNKITLIVDLSHPYAEIVSVNAKKVAEELNISYIRHIREKTKESQNAIILSSYQEAYKYLKDVKGTVFLTVGSKNIEEFQKIRGNNRFIYRILPVVASIKKCNEHDVEMRDIVAALGPYSLDYNKAMFKAYQADFVLMKDSGVRGGTMEKIKACQELNIVPLIIGRKSEKGISNLQEIEAIIQKEHMS